MSRRHDKNLNPWLNLLISCISAKSALQVLSIIGECTFLFSSFLIIGWCNSSANYLLELISVFTVWLEADIFTSEVVFNQKNHKPSK